MFSLSLALSLCKHIFIFFKPAWNHRCIGIRWHFKARNASCRPLCTCSKAFWEPRGCVTWDKDKRSWGCFPAACFLQMSQLAHAAVLLIHSTVFVFPNPTRHTCCLTCKETTCSDSPHAISAPEKPLWESAFPNIAYRTQSHWAIGCFLMSNAFKGSYVTCFLLSDALVSGGTC